MKSQDFVKSHFPLVKTISTRWTDNDIYGHVNNAVYYQYFDSVINAYLIAEGGLDIHDGDIVGFIVRSECDYFSPIAYPNDLEVGLAVEKLGNSSVQYRVGLFVAADEAPAAIGSMVHVFVDRASSRPVPIPPSLRAAMQRLAIRTAV
jgi:acyl-CoA thioester hydrolase